MRRVTLEEAKVLVARGMVEQETLRQKWAEASNAARKAAGLETWEECPETPEVITANKAWESCERKNKQLMGRLATDPELRQHMTCWSVWFYGTEQPDWFKEGSIMDALLCTTVNVGVPFGLYIRRWVESKGFLISGSGGGISGWDFDVCCDDQQATKLCELVHKELQNYLDLGILEVEIRFHNWSFKGMDWDTIRRLAAN